MRSIFKIEVDVTVGEQTFLLDLTDMFVSNEEFSVQLERDDYSGTMTNVAYELKFAKTDFRWYLFRFFMGNYTMPYLTINEAIAYNMPDKKFGIGYNEIMKTIFGEAFVPDSKITDIQIHFKIAKNESVVDTEDSYAKTYSFKPDVTTLKEEKDYIIFSASSPSLQEHFKTFGNDVLEIDVDKDILDEYKLQIPNDFAIPARATWTTPDLVQKFENIYGNEDEIHYLPSITFNGIQNLENDVLQPLNFSSGNGKPFEDKHDIDQAAFLVKNEWAAPMKVFLKGSFKYSFAGRDPDRSGYLRLAIYKGKDRLEDRTIRLTEEASGGSRNIFNREVRFADIKAITNGITLAQDEAIYLVLDLTDPRNDGGYYFAFGEMETKQSWVKPVYHNGFIIIAGFWETTTDWSKSPKGTYTLSLEYESSLKINEGLYDEKSGMYLIPTVSIEKVIAYIIKTFNEKFTYVFTDTYLDSTDKANNNWLVKHGETVFLPSEVLNGKVEQKLYISPNELLKFLRVLGYGWSIGDTEIKIAPLQAFFDNRSEKIIPQIPLDQQVDISGVEFNIEDTFLYTHVKFGFSKQEYEVFAGAADPISVYEFKTGLVLPENKTLEIITDVRMDSYGMMYELGKQYKKDTDKTNETLFAIDVSKAQHTYIGATISDIYYQMFNAQIEVLYNINNDDNKAAIDDIDRTQIFYNGMRTPENLLRSNLYQFVHFTQNNILTCTEVENVTLKSYRVFSVAERKAIKTWKDFWEGLTTLPKITIISGGTYKTPITPEIAATIADGTIYYIRKGEVFENLHGAQRLPIHSVIKATMTLGMIEKLWLPNKENDLILFRYDNNTYAGYIYDYTFNDFTFAANDLSLMLDGYTDLSGNEYVKALLEPIDI